MNDNKANTEELKNNCNDETCLSKKQKSILKSSLKPSGFCGGIICPKNVTEEQITSNVNQSTDDTCLALEEAEDNVGNNENNTNRCTDTTCPYPVNYKPKLYTPNMSFTKNFGNDEFDNLYGNLNTKCNGPCGKPTCSVKTKTETSKTNNNYDNTEETLLKFNLDDIYKNAEPEKSSPCGIPSCPFPKKSSPNVYSDKYESTKRSMNYEFDNGNFKTTNSFKCPYLDNSNQKSYTQQNYECFPPEKSSPCENKTCPFSAISTTNKKCDFGNSNSLSYSGKQSNVYNKSMFPYNGNDDYRDTSDLCAIPTCPYKETRTTYRENEYTDYDRAGLCKIPTCPMNAKSQRTYSVASESCANPKCPHRKDNQKSTSKFNNTTNMGPYKSQNEINYNNSNFNKCKNNYGNTSGKVGSCDDNTCIFSNKPPKLPTPCFNLNSTKTTDFSLRTSQSAKCPYLFNNTDNSESCTGKVCKDKMAEVSCYQTSRTNWSTSATCGGDTCFGDPLEKENDEPKTCVRCPLIDKPKKKFGPCGSPICPEAEEVEDEDEELETCGSPECRYTKQATGDVFEMCENPECPYVKERDITRNMFGDESEDEMSVCENPDCPYLKTRQNRTCRDGSSSLLNEHQAYDSSYYTADGIDCCNNNTMYSNITQASMLYGNYGEYGGSSMRSTQDGLCDCKDYNQFIRPPEPCPYMENQYMQMYVGQDRVPCPYLSSNAFGDGVCGVEKEFSCGSPLVEPCGSPDCAYKIDDECNDDTCPYVKNVSFSLGTDGSKIDEDENSDDSDELMKSWSKFGNGIVKSKITLLNDENIWEEEELEEEKIPAVLEEPTFPKKKAKKKKTPNIESYTYPGALIGHKKCAEKGRNIPANMGWLWNIKPPGNAELWRGYKPGAVSRTVHKMIRDHRRALGIYDPSDTIKKKKSKASTKTKSEEKLKNAIEIKKTDGNYFVTVNPMKDPNLEECSQNPFVECTPFQFQVVKNPTEKEAKKTERDCGCESQTELLEVSSSDSDLEFSFSPPAGLPDPRPKKKKTYRTTEAQCDFPSAKPSSQKGKKDKKGKKGKKK